MFSFLVFSWALSLGYMPQQVEIYDDPGGRAVLVDRSGCFVQDLGLEVLAWEHLRAWTNIRTYEEQQSLVSYAPFRADYSIGLDLLAGPVVLGIKHECIHPVVSYDSFQETGRISAETEVFVRFQGSSR